MNRLVGELIEYRHVLWVVVWRELKIRYKQTALGAAWALLQPLALTVLFSVIFYRLGGIPTNGIPGPLFAYSGLLPWMCFANGLTSAANSLVNNTNLITKMYVPRAVFPIASVSVALVDFAVGWVVYAGMLFAHGIPWSSAMIVLVVIVPAVAAFTLGIGLVLAAWNVSFRDVRYVIPLIVQVWLFVTPVVYPASMIPSRFRAWYMLNPMAGLVEAHRCVTVTGVWPPMAGLAYSLAATWILCIAACRYFQRAERQFADVI